MSQTTLGILSLYIEGKQLSLEERDYFKKLILQANTMDLDVFVFTPEDVDHVKQRIHAIRYDERKGSWYREWTSFPQLVFDRCRFQRTPRFRLLREFRAKYPHLTYLNRPLMHKWGTYQVLRKTPAIRPYLPETVPYRTPADLTRFLSRYALVYLKPEDGTGGRGIASVRRLTGGLCLLQGRDNKRTIIAPLKLRVPQIAVRLKAWGLGQRYLVQQGIPLALRDGRVHDYRLLIQKNGQGEWEVTGIAGRIGAKRSVTSNLHGGGMAVPAMKLLEQRFPERGKAEEVRDDMERMSHLVVQRLEAQFGSLCEMALDLAVDPKGGVWLLEVNPKPAREVFRRLGEDEVYRKSIRRPLEYALFLSRKAGRSGKSAESALSD